MAVQWYAVQSKPRQELVAETHLQRQGYTTYLPRIRLKKRRRDRWVEVTEPLFPRYLFIEADADAQSLAPVRSTQGVASLVRFGQLLRPLPSQVIDFLKAAEDTTTSERDATAWPHQPGDQLQILEGPFAGLTAIYQQADGEQRALMLIDLLGRSSEVSLPMDALGPA